MHDDTPRDEPTIKADYEALLNASARLFAYAQSSPKDVYYEISERQDSLAYDDLVLFALRARRFIEATSFRTRAHEVNVPVGRRANESTQSQREPETENFWRLITVIIHHVTLKILRDLAVHERDVAMLEGGLDAVIPKIEDCKPIRPIVIVKSDHDSCAFDLRIFLDVFSKKIFEPAVDHCANHNIYLESL